MTSPAKPAYTTATPGQVAPTVTLGILAGDGTLIPVGATNPIPVSGAGLAVVGLGQAVMADSVPVAIASDQSTVPVVDASLLAGSSHLNITGNTVVKNTAGRVFTVVVEVAGSGNGSVNDAATTVAGSAANLIAVTPQTVGPILMGGFPCANGIVVLPGTGQTIGVSFN